MDVPGIALITGAASGIGRACAHGFLNEGCAGIALLDISLENLQAVKTELEESKSSLQNSGQSTTPACRIETYELNVVDEEQVNAVIAKVAKTFGRIDYVVNAAGIAAKHAGGVAFAETKDWTGVLSVNLNGSFFVLRATTQVMLKQDPIASTIPGRKPSQRGSIINFSSIQGVVGITLSAAYAASKHAIIGLTRSASEDYAKDGIRFNAICPGYTETPLTTKNPAVLKAMQERVGTAVPMERMGNAAEIADGVLYLAGGRSSFVTGSVLMVDGGYTSR